MTLSCCVVTVAITSPEEATKLVGGMESLSYKEIMWIVQSEEEKAPGRIYCGFSVHKGLPGELEKDFGQGQG